MNNRFLGSLLAASLLAFHVPGRADDTDLFMGIPPNPADLPNVMLVLDNAANFSSSTTTGDPNSNCTIGGAPNTMANTVGGIEQCALYNVISGLADGTPINIGMMVYNANNIHDINNANCGGSNGGCLAVPLMPLNAANKASLLAWIASWRTSGGAGNGYIKASGEATAAALQETWAYLYGHTGLSGRKYTAPTLGCHTFTVFIGNSYSSSGTPGDATGDAGPKNALLGLNSISDKNVSPAATTDLRTIITSTVETTCNGTVANPSSFTFPSSSHENKGYYADEWTRYLAAQGVKNYSIGVFGSGCKAEYEALLKSMATDVGKGKYFDTRDYSELVKAINTILSEAQSVNSAFAAVSLPVSVNTQGTYLNQVFVGMFRPDEHALPRWAGNLKQYKLGYLNGTLQLLDADNSSAISAGGTGFIAECARSFWTPTATDNYWDFNPQGTCLNVANSNESNTPDGNIVEKGAQAYQLRGWIGTTSAVTSQKDYSDRKVYTCSSTSIASCTTLITFNATNTGLSSDLVDWEIGKNIDAEGSSSYKIRPSVHGDVVHSRPVAIDFGSTVGGVVVFYGGNDGMLRAINGNRDGGSVIGTASPGQELWSFVPPEFYPNIQRIYDNTTPVNYPGLVSTITPQPKPYGFDGAITAYKAGSNTWIYASMRRGGRAIYAFDVTNPSIPTLKWKAGCDSTGCTTDFSNSSAGETWSPPKVLKAPGYNGGNDPLLIMGGGYDTCEDSDTTACTTPTKGSQIYVLDADSGVVKKVLSLPAGRGVVSDVFVVPDPITQLAKYAYVGDTGGNIWRVNIGTAAPSDWTVTHIASLGCDTVTNCFPNRKFEFMPDVVYDNGKYDLLIGSGDREKPLATYTGAYGVNNYFFMVQDDPSDSTWLSDETATCGSAVICLNSLVPITLGGASPTPATVALHKGWYLQLNPHEQVVTTAITIFGTVNFSTHTPAVYQPGQCTGTLGTARVYNISYVNGGGVYGETNRSFEIDGGGLAPSPVAGMVTLDGSTTAVPFCIGCNPQSALQGGSPPPPPPLNQPKSRVYWQIER